MFELRTFPARDGDCLMLTWGTHGAPRRLLIDGGREGTWTSLKDAIQALPAAERVFELLVVTHIDADHIAGVERRLVHPCARRLQRRHDRLTPTGLACGHFPAAWSPTQGVLGQNLVNVCFFALF